MLPEPPPNNNTVQLDRSRSNCLTRKQLWTARIFTVILSGIFVFLLKDGLNLFGLSSRTLCTTWVGLGHTLTVTERDSFLSRYYRASECKWGMEVSRTREYSDDDYYTDSATITDRGSLGYELTLGSGARWRWRNGSWWHRHGADDWVKE